MKVYKAKLCYYDISRLGNSLSCDDYLVEGYIFVTKKKGYYSELMTGITFLDINSFSNSLISKHNYTKYSTGLLDINLVNRKNKKELDELRGYISNNKRLISFEKCLLEIILRVNQELNNYFDNESKSK